MAAAKKAAAKKAPARKPAARKVKAPAPVAPVVPAVPAVQPVAPVMMEGSELVTVTNAEQVAQQLEQGGSDAALAHFLQQEEAREAQQQQEGQQLTAEQQQEADAMEAARRQGALMMANLLSGGAAQGVKSLWDVDLPEKQVKQLAEKLAPVLAKNGGGMPEWLIPYKEEFELGVCVAGIGFGVWRQVQVNKVAQLEEARKRQQQQQQGQPQQRPAARVSLDSLDPNAHDEAA